MATFAFASAPTTLTLTEAPAAPGAAGRKPVRLVGSVQFSVHNLDQRLAQACRMSIKPVAPAQAQWFSFQDELPTSPGRLDDVEFDRDATRTVTVQVAIPPDAPAGQYVFTVQVAADRDTDNDVTQSPSVAFTVPEAKQAPPRPPTPRFPLWPVVVAVVLVLLAGGVAFALLWPDSKIAVPALAGKDRDSAEAALVKLGLQASATVGHDASSAGTVFATDPQAGAQVAKHAMVTLSVSDGKVLVPKLVGVNVVDAVEALKKVQLGAKAAATEPSTQPVGSVVRSAPKEGEAATLGQVVELVIASPMGAPNPCHAGPGRIPIFCNPQIITGFSSQILRQQVEILKTPER